MTYEYTRHYFQKKFNIDFSTKKDYRLPIEIPNIGRNQLPLIFNELNFNIGAEIGTETGKYAEIICQQIPNLNLTCVDAWLAYKGYREAINQQEVDKLYNQAIKRLKPYGVKIIKGLSMDVVTQFENESLDFVYIDANHTYEHVMADVTEWSKKVRQGGIVAGHDYIRKKQFPDKPSQNNEVVKAINDYTIQNKIDPWFVLGRKNKIEGEIRDGSRTWLFIKR